MDKSSLAGYRTWDCKELDTTEQLPTHTQGNLSRLNQKSTGMQQMLFFSCCCLFLSFTWYNYEGKMTKQTFCLSKTDKISKSNLPLS